MVYFVATWILHYSECLIHRSVLVSACDVSAHEYTGSDEVDPAVEETSKDGKLVKSCSYVAYIYMCMF